MLRVYARISVSIALAIPAAVGIIQTPLSPHFEVRANRNDIGKTIVPKTETMRDLPGRSSAVKYEEKHISIQPMIYENEKSFIAVILTASNSVSPGFMKIGAI